MRHDFIEAEKNMLFLSLLNMDENHNLHHSFVEDDEDQESVLVLLRQECDSETEEQRFD